MTHFLIFLASFLMAEEAQSPFQYTQKINAMLEEVKDFGPDQLLERVDGIRKELERYVEHKRGVCNGEYSTTILEPGAPGEGTYKLTKNERDLCFKELKALEVTYINNLFIARKKLLEKAHENNLDLLSKARDQAILNIDDTFEKKRRN